MTACNECLHTLKPTDRICPSCNTPVGVASSPEAGRQVMPWWQQKFLSLNLSRFTCKALPVSLDDPDVLSYLSGLFGFEQTDNFHKQNVMLNTVIAFLNLKQHEQQFVVQSCKQGVVYRGHSFDQFKMIVEDSEKFNHATTGEKFKTAARVAYKTFLNDNTQGSRC